MISLYYYAKMRFARKSSVGDNAVIYVFGYGKHLTRLSKYAVHPGLENNAVKTHVLTPDHSTLG
jgi:hypothetical protein